MNHEKLKTPTHLDEEGRIRSFWQRKYDSWILSFFEEVYGFLLYFTLGDGVYCQVSYKYLEGEDRNCSYCAHGHLPNDKKDLNDERGHQSTKIHKKALLLMRRKKEEEALRLQHLQTPKGRADRGVTSPTSASLSIGLPPTFGSVTSSAPSYFSSSIPSFSTCYQKLSAVAAAFLFQLIYWMISFNIAFHTFQPLIGLLNHSGLTGVHKFVNHTSAYAFDCFLRILYRAVRYWMLIGLHGIGEYSIVMDESTTKGNISIVIFHITFRKQNGRIITHYLGMQVIGRDGAGATALMHKLVDMLEQCGLDLKKMRAFGSDGGGALSGGENGMWQKLLRDPRFKGVIIVHCYAHQLALACAAALKDGHTDPSLIEAEKVFFCA
jgi:hypothetical protein